MQKKAAPKTKIPLLVSILARLVLIIGIVWLMVSFALAWSFLINPEFNPLAVIVSVAICDIPGIAIIILSFGIKKLKLLSLQLFTILIGIETAIYIFLFSFNSSFSFLTDGLALMILSVVANISILVYLWLSYYLVFKKPSKRFKLLHEFLQIIIPIVLILILIILIFVGIKFYIWLKYYQIFNRP